MTSDVFTTPQLSDIDTWRMLSASNLALQFESIPRAMGKPWARWDGVWAADTKLPAAYPNSATMLRPLAVEEAAEVIARLDQFYAADVGGPWMLWSAWPTPDLTPYGMRAAGQTPLMVRLPSPVPAATATGLRIIEASTESDLRDVDYAMIHGYPIPELTFPDDRITDTPALGGPLRFFVGYEDDQPVSCAMACIGEREVGIYAVATLPDRRGKGYGDALTRAALAAAPHLPAVLEASELGQPIYGRMGFQVVSEYTLWYKPRGGA
ncbi:MAG TPA: GNAT family N-acetyltransferase [Ktedonobacterales bacterium]|nr:GNAT family N-acetyltransferase [Ktedonobacterales bacterium]